MDTEQHLSKFFITESNRRDLEPYGVVIPDGVKPWMDTRITKVVECLAGTTIYMDDSSITHVPLLEGHPRPKAGDRIEIFGRGFGLGFDGLRLNGTVLYWRDREQSEAHHRRFSEDFAARTLRTEQTFRPEWSSILQFKFRDDSAEGRWREGIENNSNHPYNFVVYTFASRWAHRMESLLNERGGTVEDVAEEANAWANEPCGITGYQYGCAVGRLADVWLFGDELRVWHNAKYNVSDQQKGVVNPAILTLLVDGPKP
jgi:hypothetical protein